MHLKWEIRIAYYASKYTENMYTQCVCSQWHVYYTCTRKRRNTVAQKWEIQKQIHTGDWTTMRVTSEWNLLTVTPQFLLKWLRHWVELSALSQLYSTHWVHFSSWVTCYHIIGHYKSEGPTGTQYLALGPSGQLWALRAGLTSSLAPFRHPGSLTHATMVIL